MAVMETLRSVWVRVRAWSPVERVAGAACALVGLGLLGWTWRLWPEWRINPDLSHGFFAPTIVVMLWIRARADAGLPPRLGAPLRVAGLAAAGALLLLAMLFVTVYAVALGWSATPTLFLLGVAAAAGSALAILLASAPGVRWIGAGWPAWVIPLVLLLSAPLPPASYARLSLALQEMITVGVLESLRLFGVPAARVGNVIHLGHTSVGVEEACSGVRSLISCVLAGLVLSALLLRAPWRRVVLVLAAGPLALLTNFVRSLTLTLLARAGVDISGAWHDWLGFAVLGITTALLAWMATALEEGPATRADPRSAAAGRGAATGAAPKPRDPWARAAGLLGLGALGVAAGWMLLVTLRTQPREAWEGEAPALARMVPADPEAEGWGAATREDLGRFAGILRTPHLLERAYHREDAGGRAVQVVAYVAWWPPGGASVSSVAAHTPDACWPGTGWVSVGEASTRRGLPLAGGGELREAEERFFRHGERSQWVWYWHLVDGVPLRPFEPRSWRDQLSMFFRQGVRRDAAQAFVRLSSNRPWEEVADEALVGELLAGLAELGLPVAGAGEGK